MIEAAHVQFLGPELGNFEWNSPIHVQYKGRAVGIIHDVQLEDGGRVLHVGQMLPTDGDSDFYFDHKRLILLAAVAFFVRVAPALQRIEVTLDQPLHTSHDGVDLAAARAAVLRTIGCDPISIDPDFRASHGGQYVVKGTWLATPHNLVLARRAFEAERDRTNGEVDGYRSTMVFARLMASMRRRITGGTRS